MPSALSEPDARELWQAHYLSAVHAGQWELKTDSDRDSTYLHAVQEATQPALGSTALLERTRNGLSPSEVALLERQPVAVPEEMWAAATRTAGGNPAQVESVALQAWRAGQVQIAESLWASLTDREPRAVFNLGVMRRLWPVRRLDRELLPYMRKARDKPHRLVQTAGSMIGVVVGRDELSRAIIEDLRDPVTRRPHLVIGGMGSGKTALLVRLTRLLAERGIVPVAIRLGDAQETLDFRELARKRFVTELNTMLLSDTEGEEVWRELCRNDQVVILADGLEEALIEGNAQDERGNLIQLAIRQANARRLPLVITSRPCDSLGDLKAAIAELEPLSDEAALEYIDPRQSSADARGLDWIVETAGLAELPLYLQITRQLFRSGRLDYLSAERSARVAMRSMDRSKLRVHLLDTWVKALFDGHLMAAVFLDRSEREAAVEWLSALACIGLLGDTTDVKYDDYYKYYKGKPAGQLELSQPPPKYPEIDDKIRSFLMMKLPSRHPDIRLAVTWGDGLNLVEAHGEGLRFPHSIMQAYLASRFMSTALQDSRFRQDAMARLRSPGPEFLIALVLYARSVDSDQEGRARGEPEADSAERASAAVARPNPSPSTSPGETQDPSKTTLSSDVRSIRDVLLSCAKRARDDVKKLDLYAAALEIDSFLNESRHREIARCVADDWEDIRGWSQRSIDEAKLALVYRFGDAVRLVAGRPARGLSELDPAYGELLEMGRGELSYPIRLAIAQEIGAGGDRAFRVLSQSSYSASGSTWKNAAWPDETANTDHVLRGSALCAWLTPLLVGSVDLYRDEARQELGLWLDRVGRDQQGGGNYFHLSLEVALAQGFKYAANRRFRHPHALPATRDYMAEQAMEMLRRARFWFTQLTLIHALCLWEMPDPRISANDEPGRRGNRSNAAGSRAHRRGWNPATVAHWLELARNGRHPFVAEAGKLAVEALKTGHPERFLWIDESGVVSRVGSRGAQAAMERKHHLWIPPSAGWAALDPRALQLVADVLVLLNLADRGEGPDEIERRLSRVKGNDLPLCFTRNRDPLDPRTTIGGRFKARAGRNCLDGCPHRLCPYPPYGVQPYRSELSETFCRGQQTLLSRGLSAPWQTMPRSGLKRFWEQMAQRPQSL